ncbi:hypothetical protein ACFPME_11715 [Rhodanobacter umsongensis]|uniref:Uncharacterized protein n=1 Tax=Rhodanobacter umsongensis TaxID=633153 RepID=A0ABW0JME2_9GAMM
MKFPRHLAKVELVALASLVVVATALAIYAGISMSLYPSPEFGVADSVEVVFIYLLPIACVPVVLFVAPLYSTLLYNGRASWSAAFVVGAIPGAVILFFSTWFGLVSLACGAVVALATHAVCASGSNHSFEADGSAAAQLKR